jgi:N-acyl-D-aspartate/D-glutamate deacylase
MASTHDLVIRGGTLADGLGGELRDGDVAVSDGRIVAVGQVAGHGREEIDARGRLVTPGFVDIHTHYDGQASWDSRMQPSSLHGVTTAVMGNCGVGFAPVRADDRDRLIELMEGVEDIPGAALHEGLGWQWESFPQYLDFLATLPRDIDVAAQLPHGALRVYVMGQRATRLEPATPDDVARMRSLACDATRAGAIGFSTSRSMNHRSIKGDPTPSLKATEDELTGIGMGLADAGKGVIQIISDMAASQGDELGMVFRVARASGRPVSISLAQSHRKPEDWRRVLDRIHGEAQAGVRIAAQVAPRPVGVLFGLLANRSPLHGSDTFMALRELAPAEMVSRMRDPQVRARILLEAEARPMLRVDGKPYDYDRVFELGSPPDYEPPLERSIEQIARRTGRSAVEAAYDLMLQDEGRALLLAPFANYAYGSLDHCAEQLSHPQALFGLGDGGAHVASICDASFTTTLLGYWGRHRAGGRLPLPLLVNLLTARNAAAVGLHDRGALAAGMKADINVIDLDRLAPQVPEVRRDLPAGGRRFVQGATGYDATIVAGQVTYRQGEATGALPGRLVRA